MGTPAFAVPSLSALAASEDVTLVVTNPDRPSGRGQTLAPPPAKVEAERLGLPVFQPEKARHPDSVAKIAAERPDLIIVVAYGHILPKSILDIPKHCCINVHASLLPKYRGAAPINWAVVRGEEVTGITIMKMDVGMDTGPMLHIREMPIGGDDTAETLFPKLSRLGADALLEALGKLRAGTLVDTPQNDSLASYAPMLKKEHGRIDWSKPAVEVRNLIRGMSPWPSACTFHDGKALKVLSAAVLSDRGSASGAPGEIRDIGRGGIVVQPEGGRPMDSRAYAQGRRVQKGDRLSP
jgi:methionyl-tRNA formyltransferase